MVDKLMELNWVDISALYKLTDSDWKDIRKDLEERVLEILEDLPGVKIYEVQIEGWTHRILVLATSRLFAVNKAEKHSGSVVKEIRLIAEDIISMEW